MAPVQRPSGAARQYLSHHPSLSLPSGAGGEGFEWTFVSGWPPHACMHLLSVLLSDLLTAGSHPKCQAEGRTCHCTVIPAFAGGRRPDAGAECIPEKLEVAKVLCVRAFSLDGQEWPFWGGDIWSKTCMLRVDKPREEYSQGLEERCFRNLSCLLNVHS